MLRVLEDMLVRLLAAAILAVPLSLAWGLLSMVLYALIGKRGGNGEPKSF